MVLLLPGETGGQHLAVLADDDRADGEGGLGRRAEPGQLDRRAQEPVIRAAGAEQVTQQDHLLDPARFGQGHGIGGAVGPGGAGGGGGGRGGGARWSPPARSAASTSPSTRAPPSMRRRTTDRSARSSRMKPRDSGSPASMSTAAFPRSPSRARASAGVAQ